MTYIYVKILIINLSSENYSFYQNTQNYYVLCYLNHPVIIIIIIIIIRQARTTKVCTIVETIAGIVHL